ncbi:MAG TPA: hypothetical protein EYP57_00260 [Thermodesulfobacteriaceae bacterium]|nr:hypothetical protein [Thermodesulfobacteriaceae bacterium]
MKLHQNAKELVLIQVEGLGLILGEIRYNRQTETIIFALEKSGFFDLYFPCTLIFDQNSGPVVRPHILTAMTTSSIRIQRSRVSCFILETDINPQLVQQYHDILNALTLQESPSSTKSSGEDEPSEKPERPGKPRIINLHDQDRNRDKDRS